LARKSAVARLAVGAHGAVGARVANGACGTVGEHECTADGTGAPPEWFSHGPP
jgi:hypothetical protein